MGDFMGMLIFSWEHLDDSYSSGYHRIFPGILSIKEMGSQLTNDAWSMTIFRGKNSTAQELGILMKNRPSFIFIIISDPIGFWGCSERKIQRKFGWNWRFTVFKLELGFSRAAGRRSWCGFGWKGRALLQSGSWNLTKNLKKRDLHRQFQEM